ncbi:MAG: MerR family transcriptional regulator, partial [Rhodobacteraceae bacterium]|nr:MerR family transcriptional regulator [Paracoccaceae bacterium]
MSKSAKAFRNISEVSDWLETPTHVLRFWESKFSQIKPTKRSGGRRYYRPKDMLLIGGIKQLLHIEGHTIKGAKQVLREKGLNYVVGLSRPLDLEVYEKDVELENSIKANIKAASLVQDEKNISYASDRAVSSKEVPEQPGLFDFFE